MPTIYLIAAAIPRGQMGIVADSPAHAAAIVSGQVKAPEPVMSTVPPRPGTPQFATEQAARNEAERQSRARTSSIGGSVAFVDPSSLPGGKNNPAYQFARQEWLKEKKAAMADYDKFVREVPPNHPPIKARHEFLKMIRDEIASGPK